MRENSREGLIWDDNGLGPEPRWTRDPDLRAVLRVCRRQLGIPDPAPPSEYGPRNRGDAEHEGDDRLNVTFHADGTFNKLYRVTTTNAPNTSFSLFTPTYRSNHSIGGRSNTRHFILRVSLPVDPRNKTLGEAATLELVRHKTDIPVPRVVAFDETRNNEIGYEWLLMDCMTGVPAHYRWRKMSMREKEVLTVRVADFQAQLLRCGGFGDGFREIGTLGTVGGDSEGSQQGATAAAASATPEPGPVVSSFFFLGQRYYYPISRGPFSCSHDWLRAQLSIIIKEHTTALGQAHSELDKEYAECALRVARKLLRMLHKIFPSVIHPPERTVLWHDDLSLKNILVSPNGAVTAVIGWECASAMPRWVASQMPEFLRGTVRNTKPDRNCYTDVEKGLFTAGANAADDPDDGLDNEGKTELYWIHLMEYEQTQLRRVYEARMRHLRPEWDMEVEEGALKVDFLGAVSRCGSGFYLRRIEQWVDAIERKEYLPLMEVLRTGIKKESKEKPATATAMTKAVKTLSLVSRLS
ncbi:phosphotransferase enzyme family-domain-containing protein [Chaetomium sp. MPI-SDFR-AT-0129]|nr:phosphotransferase enzyme family-domain-containing protein [Chaetomium sp. MPI-SDFR-AT-0129]